MLNDELRVNSGLTYGASSRFNALKNGVHLQSARSQPKKLPSQLSILEVLNKLHKMVSMKNHWLLLKLSKGQFPRYETTEQQASLLTQMFWYDFDKSFINNFEKMLMTWIWQKPTN
jgi:predicted Zn-dependent peptidase